MIYLWAWRRGGILLGILILLWIGGWLLGYVATRVWACCHTQDCRCACVYTPVDVSMPWSSGSCGGLWVFVQAGGRVWTLACWGVFVCVCAHVCVCTWPVNSPVSLLCPLAPDSIPSSLPLPCFFGLPPSMSCGPLLPLLPPTTPLLLCNRDPECCWRRNPREGVEKGLGACTGA